MNSADTADQMMKMTLEGIQVAAEVGLKAGGMAARSLAVTLYAILKDNKKVKGKTNLNNLLKSDKELKVFAIHHSDLKKFCEEAKHYGVLYSVLKEKNNTDGIVDIMVKAEDASKISRMVDKFDLATIDTKAIRESVLSQQNIDDAKPLSDEEHDALLSKLMDDKENPNKARTSKDGTPFEPSSKTSKKEKKKKTVERKRLTATTDRPSVRKELKDIKQQQNLKSSAPKYPVKKEIQKESEITIMRKWFKKNDDEIIEIQVDDTERRIIVRALADLRDKQRMAHKNYDFLDSLIVKVCDANSPSIKDHYERC